MSSFTFSALCDLAGGMSIGGSKALGTSPKQIAGYNEFAPNDQLSSNYWHLSIIKPESLSQVDIVVVTPPCSGISSSNMHAHADRTTNDWMVRTTHDAIKYAQPQVIIGENAPALLGERGRPIRHRLENLALENNYSVSYIRTSTEFHGIPQKRLRSFYLIWKGDKVPTLNGYRRHSGDLRSFLQLIPTLGEEIYQHTEDELQTLSILTNDRLSYNPVTSDYLVKLLLREGKEDIALQSLPQDSKMLRILNHAINKRRQGLNFYDGSPKLLGNLCHAVMHRTFTAFHPNKETGLFISDLLALMGLPMDYLQWVNKKNINKIAQTVPTCTARDIVLEVKEALLGNRVWNQSTGFAQTNCGLKEHGITMKTLKLN